MIYVGMEGIDYIQITVLMCTVIIHTGSSSEKYLKKRKGSLSRSFLPVYVIWFENGVEKLVWQDSMKKLRLVISD